MTANLRPMLIAAGFGAMIWIAIIYGCTVFNSVIDRTATEAAEAVRVYCENFTPDQRTEFRALVNERLGDEHGVRIDCPGDIPVQR